MNQTTRQTTGMIAGLIALFLIAGATAPLASACDCDKGKSDKSDTEHCSKKKCKTKMHGHQKTSKETAEPSAVPPPQSH